MNNIRTFLYILLGVILFALWNAWNTSSNKANIEHGSPFSSSTSPAAVQSKTVTTDSNTSPITFKVKDDKFANVVSIPDSRIIKVNTDVLSTEIDLLGGNIISASLLKYPLSEKKLNEPVKLLNNSDSDLFIASSVLMGNMGPDLSLDNKALYSTKEQNYNLSPGKNDIQVKLFWRNKEGLIVTKSFTFLRNQYDIKVDYEIDNKMAKHWDGSFLSFLQRKNVEKKKSLLMRFQTFTGASISSPENVYQKITYDKLAKQNLDSDAKGGWASFQKQYFLGAWIPDQNSMHHYFSQAFDNVFTIGTKDNIVVKSNEKVKVGGSLYVGPEVASSLKKIAKGLDLTVDYGWLWFISFALFWVMEQIYKVVGNWGWSIILVTVFIKIVFYKFSEKGYRSMAKMRDLSPRLKTLKERFGDDKQKLSHATMELYKKEKINPLGGCLPTLIQIPVFIALYYVLIEAVELRQSPFVFWITDLSEKDPFYVLPILMGISMLVQQRLNPPPQDPMQEKMMMILPLVFTVFFISFPAGLVLYWFTNNCLSILQQWYIMWRMKKIAVKITS